MNPLSYFTSIPLIGWIIIIWSFIWKGFALWNSAAQKQRYWFIVFLLINTAGILEITYLFFFAKEKLTIETIKKYLSFKKQIKKSHKKQ